MERFKVISESSKSGRSTIEVECTCGWKTKAIRWSWAAHGFKRCANCKARLIYSTKEVIQDPGRHFRQGRSKGANR